MHYELILFFLLVAFVYASVGFGGGSSYLALLAIYALPFQEMKLTALVCNIIVVTGGTILYLRRGELSFRKVLPLVAASVPMAYAGAALRISEDVFFLVLGCCLLVAGVLLWLQPQAPESGEHRPRTGTVGDVLLGGTIGFLSGMVGIGGGIFLSPILNLARWDKPKRIAATASFFILVNSVAGIAGQLSSLSSVPQWRHIGLLALAVLVGGQLGARLGTTTFSQVAVRRVTATLVFAAGAEVLLKHV